MSDPEKLNPRWQKWESWGDALAEQACQRVCCQVVLSMMSGLSFYYDAPIKMAVDIDIDADADDDDADA